MIRKNLYRKYDNRVLSYVRKIYLEKYVGCMKKKYVS